MEVSRDDNSHSLSMALKQKDSKIGLLTQNVQQQESENMALEAKLVHFQINNLYMNQTVGNLGLNLERKLKARDLTSF